MAGFTTPTFNTRRFENDPCEQCCCACRRLYGRGATHMTLEFQVLPSTKYDLDDQELIPLSLSGTWVPVADFVLDTSPDIPDEFERCTWVVDWVSPNVVNSGFPVGFGNFPPKELSNPVTSPFAYSWYYVFTDTLPRYGVGHPDEGAIRTFRDEFDVVDSGWSGAEFEGVGLSAEVAFPEDILPGEYPDAPTLSDGGLPIYGTANLYANGSAWAGVGAAYVREVYVEGVDTTDVFEEPYDGTYEFIALDTSYSTSTVSGVTTISPLSGTPLSCVKDVAFRYRLGAHDEYYPETVPTCKCVAQASGEKELDVTFTPARPGDGVWDVWSQVALPDNVATGLAGRSSAWRKTMGIPPYSWHLTDTGAGLVQAVIRPRTPGESSSTIGPTLWDVADSTALCMMIAQGDIKGASMLSFESPLEIRFGTGANGPGFVGGSNVIPEWSVISLDVNGSGTARAVAVVAIEGSDDTQDFTPAGAEAAYNPTPTGITAASSAPQLATTVHGYHGVGAYAIKTVLDAGLAEARAEPPNAANLTTGATGVDGIYWSAFFDQIAPTGHYVGTLETLTVKKITLTSLDTGDEAVWEWEHAVSSTLYPSEGWTPLGAPVVGTTYFFSHDFKNTVNDFGSLSSSGRIEFPFGRYTVEVENFTNDNVDLAGSGTHTNWFTFNYDPFDDGSMGQHLGTFLYANEIWRRFNSSVRTEVTPSPAYFWEFSEV